MNIFMQLLVNIFVPVAVKTVENYVKTSDSKSDDKVLDVVKIGANYLAEKQTNNLTKTLAKELNKTDMLKVQKAR